MIEPAGEMGFLDHLEELRWRIIKGLLAIIVGSAVSFGFIDQILEILLKPTTYILSNCSPGPIRPGNVLD